MIIIKKEVTLDHIHVLIDKLILMACELAKNYFILRG